MDVQEESDLFSSRDNEEPFEGFTVRDQRVFLKEAEHADLFSSVLRKRRSHAQPTTTESQHQDNCAKNSNTAASESEIEGEEADFEYAVPKANVTGMEERRISGDESEIEGEEDFSIFESTVGNRDCTSSIEGESSSSSDNEVSDYVAENNLYTIDVETETCLDDIKESEQDFKQVKKTRAKRRSSIQDPRHMTEEPCCVENCMNKISKAQMVEARENFRRKCPTYYHQREFILDWFACNQPYAGEFVYYVSGISTCSTAWIKILGIPRSTFYNWKRDFCNGRRNAEHGASLMLKPCELSEVAINFLQKYFEENCDYLPTGDIWHLPSSSSKSDIFKEMQETLRSRDQRCCSMTLFLKIWQQNFPQVKIPKADRFSKCDTCCNITRDLRNLRDYDRPAVYQRRTDHRLFVRRERNCYQNKGELAHKFPQEFFSVAVDGMDQNKTELPFSKYLFKTLDNAWKLKVHVVGAMIHGRHPLCFLDYTQHAHDSNLTCNILLQTFWIHKDFLPRKVFIQLDNTYKENKNQYVIGLLAYLIEKSVFDQIEISFLPKGHTHIDVDQLFSRLSVAISKSGCLTFQDLLKLLRHCYKQNEGPMTQEGARVQYAMLDQVFAIREWITPHMKALHCLKDHHHFKFTRNERRKCELDYKPWCNDEFDRRRWKEVVVLDSLPEGCPELVMPAYDAVDLNRIRSMVHKCVENGVMNQDPEGTQWKEFLDLEERKQKAVEDAEQTVYTKENGNASKAHKTSLIYLANSEQRWLVDELEERTPPNTNTTPRLSDVLKRSERLERGEDVLPIYQGRYRTPRERQRQQDVYSGEDIDRLAPGMMLAVDVEKYHPEKPQIAKVLSIKDQEDIEVLWYIGTWSGSWRVHKVRNGRSMIESKEVIPVNTVKLFNFTLTPTGKLKHSIKTKLREIYTNEDGSDQE